MPIWSTKVQILIELSRRLRSPSNTKEGWHSLSQRTRFLKLQELSECHSLCQAQQFSGDFISWVFFARKWLFPSLTARHRTIRLRWAMLGQSPLSSQVLDIIFSDESWIRLPAIDWESVCRGVTSAKIREYLRISKYPFTTNHVLIASLLT